MNGEDLTAKATISIHAPAEKVWEALTTPGMIKQYMFGADVKSKWREGSDITWEGEFNGKPYKDHGKIKSFEPAQHLCYSHQTNGAAKGAEHTVDIRLTEEKEQTLVELTQDNNASEEAKIESEKNWNAMLTTMKSLLEKKY